MTQTLRLSRRGALALMSGGAALAGPAAAIAALDPAVFTHGIAAGDPTQGGFVIWTRAMGQGGAAKLRWEVAEDEGFTRIIQSGTVQATAARDHTAKVDVTGLRAGREYVYRFHSADAVSPVGRARTLPGGNVEQARLAVVSCSHYGFGYFNAYRAIAELEEPVDAVVHLGDYIYEYGVDGYGGPESRALGREHDPAHEIVTLDDYRRRFAQYRTDPDLQAAHARAAFITVWDDHETANNSWMGGSSAHDEDTEGPWDQRRDAAIQAYFEWLPMRDPAPGRPAHVLNRVYDFGDLLSLIAVETRLTGRTQPPSASREMIFDAEGRPDAARFEAEVLNRPERSMMGAAQEAWLEDALTASVQRGTTWQMLANQVVVARMRAPDFMSVMPEDLLEEAMSRPGSRRWLESTRLWVCPSILMPGTAIQRRAFACMTPPAAAGPIWLSSAATRICSGATACTIRATKASSASSSEPAASPRQAAMKPSARTPASMRSRKRRWSPRTPTSASPTSATTVS